MRRMHASWPEHDNLVGDLRESSSLRSKRYSGRLPAKLLGQSPDKIRMRRISKSGFSASSMYFDQAAGILALRLLGEILQPHERLCRIFVGDRPPLNEETALARNNVLRRPAAHDADVERGVGWVKQIVCR